MLCYTVPQANTLIPKFGVCAVQVKATLFKANCTPVYIALLWRRCRRSSIQKFTLAYNDGMRLQFNVPQLGSARQLFVRVGVYTCSTVLCNLMYRCMCWLSDSEQYCVHTDQPCSELSQVQRCGIIGVSAFMYFCVVSIFVVVFVFVLFCI